MTNVTASFLDVIAADESGARLASRKAVIAAKQRVDDAFGKFIEQHGMEAFNYAAEDIKAIAHEAAEDYGVEDSASIFETLRDSFESILTQEGIEFTTSSVHESRKPKMCPFHSDVVGISLAQGEAKAGFEAMAQHWGGSKHCQGEGYEGSKCNFKPQMTTQSFWDERAEKAEERKQQRAEQLEQGQEPTTEEFEENEPVTEETPATETIDTEPEGAEVISFPSNEPSAVGEGVSDEIPMSMAAKTAANDALGGKGEPEPKIDKRKWTPQSVPFLDDVDDKDGRWPTRHQDIIEPIQRKNTDIDPLKDIGEQVTERVELPSSDDAGFTEGGPTKGDPTRTFPNVNQADPVTSAKIPDDVDKNPITAIIQGEYDGFLPASVTQQAIAAARK